VTPATDFPERFLDLSEVYLNYAGNWQKMVVTSARLIARRPLLRFDGINSREEASRLTNREIAVTDDRLVDLPDGSYFLFDLIGCSVVDSETGKKLGDIINIEQYPANDVYVISLDDRTALLPAVKEYVREVDIAHKRVIICRRGLIDEA